MNGESKEGERDRSDAKSKKAKFNKAMAAAVEKKISEQKKASKEEKTAGDELRSLITSIVKGNPGDNIHWQMNHYHWSSHHHE